MAGPRWLFADAGVERLDALALALAARGMDLEHLHFRPIATDDAGFGSPSAAPRGLSDHLLQISGRNIKGSHPGVARARR